ncbi:hypothetical protein FRACA_3300003 [Frankia canadensis]|uniref:Uncharacterized protein n=1 Tax=Frankia canadensis TaxID=1836972 RepID=A0A2I2KUV9_9ACTN|nr:hypothetical protein FRACA_3300003 [Frankia canadensis]SOU56732.1 hypothetical protein FRACA_3300003 [Frankia canadensis]
MTVTFGFDPALVARAARAGDPTRTPPWLRQLPAFSIDRLEPVWTGGDRSHAGKRGAADRPGRAGPAQRVGHPDRLGGLRHPARLRGRRIRRRDPARLTARVRPARRRTGGASVFSLVGGLFANQSGGSSDQSVISGGLDGAAEVSCARWAGCRRNGTSCQPVLGGVES